MIDLADLWSTRHGLDQQSTAIGYYFQKNTIINQPLNFYCAGLCHQSQAMDEESYPVLMEEDQYRLQSGGDWASGHNKNNEVKNYEGVSRLRSFYDYPDNTKD